MQELISIALLYLTNALIYGCVDGEQVDAQCPRLTW